MLEKFKIIETWNLEIWRRKKTFQVTFYGFKVLQIHTFTKNIFWLWRRDVSVFATVETWCVKLIICVQRWHFAEEIDAKLFFET